MREIDKLQRALVRLGQVVASHKFWIDLFIMTVAMLFGAAAVYYFLVPSRLVTGSATGLALVFSELLPFVSLGTMIFVINLVLLVVAFFLVGSEFGIKTVYTSLIMGPMVDFFGMVYPVEESFFTRYVAGVAVPDVWLDLVCFILVMSLVQSVLFNINASTGGLDVLAKVVNKYFHVDLGVAVSIVGGLVCLTAFLINDVAMVLIGFVATWLNGVVLNYFMTILNSRTRVYIISKEWEQIQRFIITRLNRGVTMHHVVGGYSGEEKIQIESILTRDEFGRLLDYIDHRGFSTFISADSVSEVYGQWNKKRRRMWSKNEKGQLSESEELTF